MRCPYKNFEPCLLEECPACEYEVEIKETFEGRKHPNMSVDEAIRQNLMYVKKTNFYKFKNCKLVENSVRLPDKRIDNTKINNTKQTVTVKSSIF